MVWCGCAVVCFESIMVSGAEAVQAARMGTYTKLANVTQQGRPVYQRVGPTVMYLYYSSSYWLIGSNYTSGSSSVGSSANSAAACPDQATGWEVATGSGWVGTYPITVVQATGPTRPPTLPTAAAPTNAGKRSRCVRRSCISPAMCWVWVARVAYEAM